MTTLHAGQPTLFGHPTGLFALFFAEMWERFSYYGMRALLLFYMIKGFLGYNDTDAYAVYGAYTALVYMTPYFGGMLADRLLGRHRAVILGGVLMAAGHLLMGIESEAAFFGALALLIVGNGFFKPNISTIVGELYPKSSDKKDSGFTIFYMGINLGAAMSPIVCGYVGETYGWHYGFGLATIGMLIGVAVFAAPTRVTQAMIGISALATAIVMPFWQDTTLQLVTRLFMAGMLVIAAATAIRALNRGPLSKGVGAVPDRARLKKKVLGPLSAEMVVYLGTALSIVAFAFIVQKSDVAKWVLNITGLFFLGYMIYEMAAKCTSLQRRRLGAVLVLIFFNMLFWAFFEQAGSSLNNWTDRNIDRVFETRTVTADEVGTTLQFRVPQRTEDPELSKLPVLTQEQLGYANGDKRMLGQIETAIRLVEAARNEKRSEDKRVSEQELVEFIAKIKAAGDQTSATFTMTGLSYLRGRAGEEDAPPDALIVDWRVVDSNVGMAIAESEIPASEYQAANPIYILLFGLLFSALWAMLAKRGRDPSTPVKFALGMAQLGLGFGVFWLGAQDADGRGMSSMMYLLLGWLVITTGELCLSPVGLAMVTRLAPKRMVSTVMGGWFLATAFSNLLASVIATFTGVSHGDEKLQFIPEPSATVETYGDVFGIIAIAAFAAAVLLFALKWLLNSWMQVDAVDEDDAEELQPQPAEA